jgi:peptidyl-prolyl cis-trans isomerase C
MEEQQVSEVVPGKSKKRLAVLAGVIVVIGLTAAGLWRAGMLDFLSGGEVIIIVDGEGLTKPEFDWRLKDTLRAQRQRGQDVPEEAIGKIREQILQRMIDQQLIYERGKRLEMVASEAEVESAWQARIGSYPSKEALEAELAEQGMEVSLYRELLKREIVINQTIELQMKDIRVNDAEIKQVYDRYKDRFDEAPEEIRAAHILLMVAEGGDDAAALAAIKGIRQRAIAGEDFGDLAAAHSQEPGANQRRGDLGYFAAGQMVPTFEEAAFALKTGEISQPVKTRFGYHLIKLIDRLPAGKRSFEQAKPSLSRMMLEQMKQQRFMSFLNEVRANANIEYKPGFEVAPPQVMGAPPAVQ